MKTTINAMADESRGRPIFEAERLIYDDLRDERDIRHTLRDAAETAGRRAISARRSADAINEVKSIAQPFATSTLDVIEEIKEWKERPFESHAMESAPGAMNGLDRRRDGIQSTAHALDGATATIDRVIDELHRAGARRA